MQILNCEQGTSEWLNARLGIITASNAELLLVNGKNEFGIGADLIKYLDVLGGERFTGSPDDSFTGNQHTERGHILEPIVSDYYVACGYANADEVQQVGIVLNHADKCGYHVGASPDRLVGDKGGLEIKTRLQKLQFYVLRTGDISKKHEAQIQFSLWVTGREWWDYMSYCENMPPFYKRFYPDVEMFEKFESKAKAAYEWLDAEMQKMVSKN